MNKCLRITFQGELPADFMRTVVLKHAKKLAIEGTAQRSPGKADMVKIIACGAKDAVDDFLDMLYKGLASLQVDFMEVEPYFKEKDYRGIFRVID